MKKNSIDVVFRNDFENLLEQDASNKSLIEVIKTIYD